MNRVARQSINLYFKCLLEDLSPRLICKALNENFSSRKLDFTISNPSIEFNTVNFWCWYRFGAMWDKLYVKDCQRCIVDFAKMNEVDTPDYILTWAETQFKNEVKVVIIDPMAQIDFQSTGRNQYQAENAFIQKSVTLSQRYNACFVLVVHTVKSYDNHIPDMSNLQGGAALSRLASSIVILHNHDVESKRKLGNNIFLGNGYTKQAEFNKIIHVAKARNSERSGVNIAFDFKNANFNEIGFFAPKSQLRPEPVQDKYTSYTD